MPKLYRFGSLREAFEAGVREGIFRHRQQSRSVEADIDWEETVDDAIHEAFGKLKVKKKGKDKE